MDEVKSAELDDIDRESLVKEIEQIRQAVGRKSSREKSDAESECDLEEHEEAGGESEESEDELGEQNIVEYCLKSSFRVLHYADEIFVAIRGKARMCMSWPVGLISWSCVVGYCTVVRIMLLCRFVKIYERNLKKLQFTTQRFDTPV